MSIDFWSAFCGLIGTAMLFFFGLPPAINKRGHGNLILEQVDKKEVERYKLFQKLSYLALSLIIFSFFLQLIESLT